MRHFTCVQDLGDLKQALNEAFEIKKDRFQFSELGKNKTLLMIFFNSSLRTRLSTQKAAMNLGMNTIVLDVNQGAWKLETERGVIMDGDKPEHLLEAVPVMGCYCDVIGVRSFARFENKEDDYNEKILSQFIEHSGRPVFSMEAATRHPLQSFADLITIEEYKKTARPKVVMTWAPHPKSLPQAVPNSFAEWMNATDYEFVITHPEGYELDPRFVGNAKVEYDQNKEDDYNEKILSQFIEHSGRPVFSMEAATRHPLQSFADLITIEEYKKTARPKVVMTWAPHPKSLPQAVPNSFAEWMNATDYEFVITHPEGYELDPRFVSNAKVEYDQKKAFEGADFIYAKNWSAYKDPNYGQVISTDRSWTVDAEKMALTNNAYFMHCLPVRRNMIVTDDVIESPQSIVIPEAANREISAQTVLKKILMGLSNL